MRKIVLGETLAYGGFYGKRKDKNLKASPPYIRSHQNQKRPVGVV
jgi:hypothetical protein